MKNKKLKQIGEILLLHSNIIKEELGEGMERHKAKILQIQQILNSNVIDLKKLRECCSNGGCPNESVRSIIWKIFLNYLPCDKSKWDDVLQRQRDNYKQFIREIILRPGNNKEEEDMPLIDHPLNSDPSSEWSSYFKDNETLLQIDKDVRRLCPDLAFFQKATEYPCIDVIEDESNKYESLRKRVEKTQLKSHEIYKNRYGITTSQTKTTSTSKQLDNDEYTHLTNGQEAHWEVVERILFMFAKLNPGQGYVQGMNEIIGPIYYTFATDPDPKWREYAETDCFYCFTNLMGAHGVRDNFVEILDNTEWGIRSNMKRLYDLIKRKDFSLYQILEKQLKPEYFAFRWLTLLLSQEFDLPDVITLWDVLFADKDLFDFLLHICCAMLVLQRDSLLKNDFSSNIKILQSYPSVDIHCLLDKARQLRNQ